MELIIWLGLGIAGYFLAQRKKRNEWLGFLAGIIFGVFAIIYYLLVGEKKDV